MEQILILIGAISSVIGTALIWIDAQKVSAKVTDIILDIAGSVGYWRDNPIEKGKIEGVVSSTKRSMMINKRGFVLILIGFVFQVVASIYALIFECK